MSAFEQFVSTLNPTLSAEAVLNQMIERLGSATKLPKDWALFIHPDKLESNTSKIAEYLKSRKDAEGKEVTPDFYFKGLDAWIKQGKRVELDEESEVEQDDGQTKQQLKAQEKDFIDAAQSGTPADLETVKKLFHRSSHHKYLFNINAQNEDGYTALMMAASNNHIDIVKELLKSRYTDVNLHLETLQEQTALKLAVNSDNTDCVKLLLKAGATPLSEKDEAILDYIKPILIEELQASQDTQEINFYTLKLCTLFFPDLYSERTISSDCATKLLKKTLHKFGRLTKNNAFYEKDHACYEKMALWLIAHGADLMADYKPHQSINNKPIPTSLFDAAIKQGNQAIVEAMIKKGAQPGVSVSIGFNAPKSKYIKKLLIRKGCVEPLYQNTMKSFKANLLRGGFEELIDKDLILETLQDCITDNKLRQVLNVLELYTQLYPKSAFKARKLFKKKWPDHLPSQSIFKSLRYIFYKFITFFFGFFTTKKLPASKTAFSSASVLKPRATVEEKNLINNLFNEIQNGKLKLLDSLSSLEATHLLEKTLYTLKIGLGALDEAAKIKMNPQDSIEEFASREDEQYKHYQEMVLQLINKGAELTDVSIKSALSIIDKSILSAMIGKLLVEEAKNKYIKDGVGYLIALTTSLPKKFKEAGIKEEVAGVLLRAGSEISDSVINGISLKAYCEPLMIPTLDLCIQENDL